MATNTTNLNLVKPDLTDPVDIDVLNGNADILDGLGVGYRYVQTIYYTSNGTFTKASYPWLRAIRVKVCGGGGGGGGATTTAVGNVAFGISGGGGAYAESFITDIAGLDASVTVTRGAGGAGAPAGNNSGGTGGQSSFGGLVSANGGLGGAFSGSFTPPGTVVGASGAATGTGDLVIAGDGSGPSVAVNAFNMVIAGPGGSHLGGGIRALAFYSSGGDGISSSNRIGAGGTGGYNTSNQGTARAGGTGDNGIVIVELYA